MKRITDPSFRYVPAAQTDIRRTFARLRKEQRAAQQQAPAAIPLKPRTQKGKP